MSSPPLAGVKVIDLSRNVPGSYTTWLLGDLGADVVRVEHAGATSGQKTTGESRAARTLARNKRSLLIDLYRAETVAAVGVLVRDADVLIEDYRPGVMTRMGLGYEAMAALNPALVYCSISLCGHTGPYASRGGHDSTALAIAGVLSQIGESAEAPCFPGIPVADLLAGSNAALSILAAVRARDHDGLGQQIDIAMSDSAMAVAAVKIDQFGTPGAIPPRNQSRPDAGIWRTADDRWLCTADKEPRYWARLCTAIGRPDLIEAQHDAGRAAELTECLRTTFASRDLSYWLETLAEADTLFAAVSGISEALDDPHVIARDMAIDVPTDEEGTVRQIGSPLKLSRTPVVPPRAALPAGTEGAEILREIGFDDTRIAALLGHSIL